MDYQNSGPRPDAVSAPRASAPSPSQSAMTQTALQSCLVAGCVTVLVPVLMITGFFIILYFLIAAGMGESSSSFDSLLPVSASANLREKQIRTGDVGRGTIAIVSINGVIDGGGSPLEGDGALAFVSEQLRAAREDKRVKAVILQIDSPGGGLTASDQLYNEVLRLREENKTVIAWAGSLMASGGYYIAAGADGIMASPTTTVGSIGVIMQHFLVRDLLEKIGISSDPIVSGPHKDIGSPFREMTDDERELLQNYIDSAHRRFVEIVAKSRNMDPEDAANLADGSIFSADTARENGLVDRIGYIHDALKWAEEKAGEKNMRVVSYKRALSVGDLFREAGGGAAEAAIEAASKSESAPRAMAIWEGR